MTSEAAQVSAWVKVGPLDSIPRLGARVLRTETHGDIAVFRTADDAVFALRDRCPHKGGPLSQGIVFGTTVACPLHGWSIRLDDGNAMPPDTGCTQAFRAKIENGHVLLEI